MKQNSSYLKDENLLTLLSLNNLIIPEIQREYVWGLNLDVLNAFLEDIKKKAEMCEECHHAHGTKKINVGFLYSYKPSYTSFENARYFDEYLIDGQQRITTLFLLLLWRAAVEERLEDFMSIIRLDNYPANFGFNYKVRTLTQHFIYQLINQLKSGGCGTIEAICGDDYPYWILFDYQNDPTVKSMIGALKSIISIFGDKEAKYFDYLISNIRFWHFKTEATSQGEELYITMNSRGEQLSDNEMKKSRVLPDDKLEQYGQLWEEWQNEFWLRRAGNPNADKGFNCFLSSIEGLEAFEKSSNGVEAQKVNISDIELYVNGLIYISREELKQKVKDKYTYSKWFDDFINELWGIINQDDVSWTICNPKLGQEARKQYNNSSTVRNVTMLFWPWMTYFKKLNGSTPEDGFLIRLLHFYYVRYHCFKRSTTTIEKIVGGFMNTEFNIDQKVEQEADVENIDDEDTGNKIFSKEELILSSLASADLAQREEIESLIWEIQDIPYLKDGRDVGGNTILSFLSECGPIVTTSDPIESLKNFKNTMKALFCDNANKKLIKEILLFYKSSGNEAFWIRQSPYYYFNYETSVWKRIVRGECFLSFFKELQNSIGEEKLVKPESSEMNDILKNFLDNKRKEFFSINSSINRDSNQWSHRKLAIIYDFVKDGGLWDDEHENLVFWPEDKEGVFLKQHTLWRGKRYYDNSQQLTLPDDWVERLNSKYAVTVKPNENENI